METVFTKQDREKAEAISQNPFSKFSALDSRDLQDLAVNWSYYSGKIEGNTYTYAETVALLVDGVTSAKSYSDALMLKNLHNTFISVIKAIKRDKFYPVTQESVFALHARLTDGLLPPENSGALRTTPVRITGVNYVPPQDVKEIQKTFDEIFAKQEAFRDQMERAVYLHCNLAKLQPFRDGNKRTSRMLESIVMMNNDRIPVYSADTSDILNYRVAIIDFYETGKYDKYVDFFLNRQIAVINQLSPQKIEFKAKSVQSDAKLNIATKKRGLRL